MTDKAFLQWVHDRLTNMFGDPTEADYMHKLRGIIEGTPDDKETGWSEEKFDYGKEVGSATIYCPKCDSELTATNIEDVVNGEADGYVFVHNDIVHTQADLDAIEESKDERT